MPGLKVCLGQWAGKQGQPSQGKGGVLLSGFNRRQIVWELWQNERADKFIREKLPVGVFVGRRYPSRSQFLPLQGPPLRHFHQAPSYMSGTGPSSVSLAAASTPGLPRTLVLWGQEPHSKGEYRLNEKSHPSPDADTYVHCPLPQLHSTPCWLWDKTVPQGRLWVTIPKTLGLWP